ncbi:DUF554 domain-containing protein [uncultured Fretibacterium sp.]|uniref:DUF554 domain-containing protein n=1 Tax=uncultured Fretibacterium sp. TaxID=1678694 RepID=UPI0026237A88|nr:DUF554 domain-containing protein [uncultured Fretibacterium sp.]
MEFLSGIPAGGTLFNALAILLGGAIGLFAGRLVSERVQRSIFQCLGLFCLYLGADMALRMQHVLAVLLSFILGTAAGELMDLDVRLNALSDRIKARLRIGSETFTEGFVTATLLFCIGSMAILGAIEDGVRGNPGLLVTKGVMDGTATLFLTASLGVGVLFSALPVLLYQGALTLAAGWAQALITPAMLADLSGLGGLMIMGIGLNLLRITEIRTGNMLPGLVLMLLFSALF